CTLSSATIDRLYCTCTGCSTSSIPEALAGQFGAFGEGVELGPHHTRIDLGPVGRLRREAAVGASQDVLAADELRVAANALRDELRMLDKVVAVGDHTRDQ